MTATAPPIARYSPAELAHALGLFEPTDEQAAIIAAPPGPLVVIAGAGAGKTETMAARVVWLVANGYAEPGQVLGLTFTRKAAGQLLRRVRSRLARLSGAGLAIDGRPGRPAGEPAVSTYHAFAGQLLREYGLLSLGAGEFARPVEPDTRLLSETELWQLAFDVVNAYPSELHTDKTPAAVTAMVLRLSGQLAEHLVDTGQLRDTHVELDRLVHTLPAGPYQRGGRGSGPSQWLLRMLATQAERAELVPLIDALHRRMRAEKVMDFGTQMASAARLALAVPQVGEQVRSRYRVVLLDEYQDTGYAQRILLSSLFGGGVDENLALTAVGDPIQSIYGWRGASATNLPRFTTDFPLPDGSAAPVLELSTSWRNPPTALHVANAVAADARRRSVAVHALRSRPGAAPGTVRVALLADVQAEREWVADHLQRRYQQAADDGVVPPTAAILVRRNADAAPMATVLRARGIPVEVVGLAGLLSVPEVADVVAMLRLVADPSAGAAAMRVLTGPRWRLGGRDVAALWQRTVAIASAAEPGAAGRHHPTVAIASAAEPGAAGRHHPTVAIASAAEPGAAGRHHPTVAIDGGRAARTGETAELIAEAAGPQADTAGLADALADPGPAVAYSVEGFRRITALAEELSVLRSHLGHPLPDLVAEVRRLLGVDCEVRAAETAAGWAGTEQLDAFADVVSGYAERAAAAADPLTAVTGLLAYLDAAAVVENGLPPAQSVVAQNRVQVLTVHAAKGLEWQVVVVPHLSGGLFPSTATARTWLTDAADLPPLLRGDRSTKGVHGVPVLDTSDVTDRKQLSDRISEHRRQLEQRRLDEERRLLYVAITRAEDTLLLSGHQWGATGIKSRGPSDFLCELKDIIDQSAALGEPCGVIEHWTPAPADGDRNPLRDSVREAAWPVDPLGNRRADVELGAALVTAAMSADAPAASVDVDSEGWADDVDALLSERARVDQPPALTLPSGLSVSSLVDLARDPEQTTRRLMRRLPTRPEPHALLGNAFHDWVERFYGSERLFDLADLPGAADTDIAQRDAEELAALQGAFLASPWAARTPVAVEVPFEMAIGSTVVRGRIDAVFAEPDGGATVVDWKTGEPPHGSEAAHRAAIQLGVYRLAWAGLSGCREALVRTAFHYVRTGRTVIPDVLPGPEELAALLVDRPH